MHTTRPDRWAIALLTILVLAVPLLHGPRLSDPFEFPKDAAILVGALLLCGLALAGAGARRGPTAMPRSIVLAAGGLLLSAGVATLLSSNRPLAFADLVRLAAFLVVGGSVARYASEARDAAWLMRAAATGAALVAAGTLVQVAVPGWSLSVAGISLLPPVPAGATLGDPGLAIQFLLLAAPLALGAAALASPAGRLLWAAALGLILATVIFAGRPEGWIAAALVALALLATRLARAFGTGGGWKALTPDLGGSALRAALVSMGVVLLVVAVSRMPGIAAGGAEPMTPLPHVGLLAPTTGDPSDDRRAAIAGTTALLALHPLGVGPGDWRHAFLEVAWTRVTASPFSLSHQAVHVGNSLLELASEIGVAGGALFVALVLLLLTRAARAAFRDPGPAGTAATAAFDVMVAALVVAFLGSPFQDAAPVLLFCIGAGLALAPACAARDADASRPEDRVAGGRAWPVPLRLALAGLWLAGAFALGAWLTSRAAASRLTSEGQARLASGDLKGAIVVLSQPSLLRSPDHLPHVLLGDACLRAGRSKDAIAAFDATLARSPWYLSAYVGRAAANQELGFYDRADDDLNAALAIDPGNADLLMSLGRLDARRGRLDQAIADFRRATEKNTALPEAWYAIGEIYARRGEYDAAIEAFRSCAAKNPRHPNVYLSLGDAFEHKGIYEMAVTYYQRAASLDERAVEPRIRLANMFHATGKDCEARDSLLAARDLETDPERRAAILKLIEKVDAGCQRNTRQSAR